MIRLKQKMQSIDFQPSSVASEMVEHQQRWKAKEIPIHNI